MAQLNLQFLRSAAPIILGAGLFALGLYALYHLLKPVNPADVAAQIRATPMGALAAAFGATAIGYVALIFYDWFGLRFIGKTLDRCVFSVKPPPKMTGKPPPVIRENHQVGWKVFAVT